MKKIFALLPILVCVACSKKTINAGQNNSSGHSLAKVEWLENSRMQIGETGTQSYFSYPRMTQLHNGTLMLVYEHGGSVYSTTSTDEGDSWSDAKLIAERRNNINASVPEIIQLKNNDLIVGYNLRPRKQQDGTYDPDKKFGIAIKRSTDLGQTWSDEKIVYEAGSDFENGCWEPAFVQLPGDEVYLFYSDEGPYTSSNEQNISLFSSTDYGKTWSTSPQIISFSKGYRDGMPVPLVNKKGELLFSVEDNSDGGEFKPSVIKAKLPWNGNYVDENSGDRIKLLRDILPKDVYAGAPYLQQLGNGNYLLSFQSTNGRKKKWDLSDAVLVVLDEDMKQHAFLDKPFNIPDDRSALWNSFYILNDGKTIIYLTSTNAFNNYNAVWLVKGKITY